MIYLRTAERIALALAIVLLILGSLATGYCVKPLACYAPDAHQQFCK